MGNSGRTEYIADLEELAQSEDSVVVEHAKWAIERLSRNGQPHYFAADKIAASVVDSE